MIFSRTASLCRGGETVDGPPQFGDHGERKENVQTGATKGA
ncbi:MAG: hypothetical protein ACYDAA_14380 [Syntrophales bacterium]